MALKLILYLLFAIAPSLHFHHKGVESGLAQLPINGLYQDENGTLWVGTREGIKYSEGSRFYPLPLADRNNWVMSNRVPTICGDGRGSIFINANYTILRYNLEYDQIEILYNQENTSSPPELSIHYGPSGLWIGCGGKILLWNPDTGATEVMDFTDEGLSISSLLESKGGTLWVGTKKGGLFSLNTVDGSARNVIKCNEVISLFSDSKNRIWCCSLAQGVICLDTENIMHFNTKSSPAICNDYVRAVSEDQEGRIWIGTSQGIDLLDTALGSVYHQGLSTEEKAGLNNLSIWSLLKDKSGSMWIGSYFGGLDYCTVGEEPFEFDGLGFTGNASPPVVGDVVFDKYGTGWFGTEGKALVRYRDGKAVSLTQFPFSAYNIKSMLLDRDSVSLWISTHMGGLWKYNPANDVVTHYTINPKDHTSRSESLMSAVRCGDNLYIGTLQGVYLLSPGANSAVPIAEINRHIYEADKMLVSSDSSAVWIVGNSICRYNPSNGVVDDYSESLVELSGGSTLTSTSIIETRDGCIFVGTAGSGLLKFNREKNSFSTVTTRNSKFTSEYIGPIHETSDGRLLIGTSSGLCWYDPQTGYVDNFEYEHGFPLPSMFPGCIAEHGGNLFLGGSNGITISSERKLKDFCMPCSLSPGRLLVNGVLVRPGDESGILKKSLRYTDRITLPHYNNDFSLVIGSDTPSFSEQVHYMYKLQGHESDWHTQPLAVPINYSNLSPGHYTLLIRNASPAAGEQVTLQINIRPPFYSSWYAWVIYILALTGIAGFILYFFYTKVKLTASLSMERQKMRFFANMSHELRTPLTLLIGGLDLFRNKQALSETGKKDLEDIRNTAAEMADLVNNQMDLLKMGEGAFSISPQNGDMVSFIKEIVSKFKVLSEQKKIALDFVSEVEECRTTFDREQMKKVFNNLLSNAFKYTEGGRGKIRVSITAPQNGLVCISVKDNGIGIDEPAQSKVFDRFFQAGNKINSDPSVTGTGIGLYTVSQIVSLHDGKVKLKSTPGKGSTFTVCLPVSTQDVPVNPEPIIAQPVPPVERTRSAGTSAPAKSKRLLVVEDDAKIRSLLQEIFNGLFEIHMAENGKEGLEAALEIGPDLIISDIMMPVMGGEEFCRRIKSEFSTCHIPVILLTALADVQNRISGFDCGADDYIAKPFNTQLLIARCMAIINNRELLHKRFSLDISSNIQMLSNNDADIAFMDKLVKIVEGNLPDKIITVPRLCEQMAMGHTKLFNKIKGLTGGSPQEFIQNTRIKYAARMLREHPEFNVSDVAFQLGYSSLNYFEKCFRKAFGQTPSAYRKTLE